MNTLEVFITERVMGGNYCDNKDCPLYRALKDQHPNLKFDIVVGFGYIQYADEYIFKPSEETPWNSEIHEELVSGEKQFPYRILLEETK